MAEKKGFGVASLVTGAIMIAYAIGLKAGVFAGAMAFLHTTKEADQQFYLAIIFGGLAILIGVIDSVREPQKTNLDKLLLEPMPGVMYLVGLSMFIRWYADPMFKLWGGQLKPTLGFDIYSVLNLNYVFLGIILGMIVTNTMGIPKWASSGIKTSRFVLKMGVITLGSMYSILELAKLGQISLVMIAFFVMGTVILVLMLGKIFNTPKSMTGVLATGVGVCGVSAAVASAPVVRAKSSELAYTIGTILTFGIVCMFIFPTVGKAIGMTPTQFGAWAGTGILNSAQVAAASLAYDAPGSIETLKVGEIFNITRILFLPFIVILLAVWYGTGEGEEAGSKKESVGKVIVDKFPIFVLGFILMFAASSMGVFGPKSITNFEANEKKQLKEEDIKKIEAVIATNTKLEEKEKKALEALVEKKQVTDKKQLSALKDLTHRKVAKDITDKKAPVETAIKNVERKNNVLEVLREFMIWFFAYGLVGLGMQITISSLRQAGGMPLVIGIIAGIAKASLSFFAVLWLISDKI
jgi:uncharacterized integral membrane protein (TIGR00698 family)